MYFFNVKLTIIIIMLLSQISWAIPKNVNSLESIKKLGVLTVCSQAGFIPFEYKNNKGEWQGFDVDLMKAFSKYLGVKLQMIDTKMEGLIPSLQTGKCDFIASGLTITEERKNAVLFSKPVHFATISAALLDNPENRKKYKIFSDIDKEGIKIASHTGSAATLFLKDYIKNANHLQFDTLSDQVSALIQKKVETFVDDDIFIREVSKEMKTKFYTIISNNQGYIAMAARKEDDHLINKFNKFLDHFEKSDEYKLLKEFYFK